MPDSIARKRLKKRMLDRWENEGGKILPDPTSEDQNRPSGEKTGARKQRLISRNESTIRAPASPTRRRKPTPK